MATPDGPRGQIRDIERHDAVRRRGSKAPGVRRGLNARGLRELRAINRPPHRYNMPSTLPLTQVGWMVVCVAILVLIVLATIAIRFIR